MKIWLLIIIGFVVLEGCFAGNKHVIGLYKVDSKSDLINSSIELHDDGSFLYKAHFGDFFKTSVNGTWALVSNNKFISLTSIVPSEKDIYNIVEKVNDSLKGKLRITVYYKNGDEVVGDLGLLLLSADNALYAGDDNGKHVYEINTVISEFFLDIFGFKKWPFSYKPVNAKANDFFIYIKLNNPGEYRFFNNELWRIKGQKLIDNKLTYKNGRTLKYYKTSASLP